MNFLSYKSIYYQRYKCIAVFGVSFYQKKKKLVIIQEKGHLKVRGKLMLEIVIGTLGFNERNPALRESVLESRRSNDWVQSRDALGGSSNN